MLVIGSWLARSREVKRSATWVLVDRCRRDARWHARWRARAQVRSQYLRDARQREPGRCWPLEGDRGAVRHP